MKPYIAAVTRSTFVLIMVLGLLVTSCDGRRSQDEADASEHPERASANLPELATVGGAQDVWPFEFGLDASRPQVEEAMGRPAEVTERPAGTQDSPGRVVTYEYPAVSFQFFVSAEGQDEFLLSATVTSPEVALRGGLSVGMPVDDALMILGDPDVEDNGLLVYFYFTSTIELYVSEGTVDAVMLARALP